MADSRKPVICRPPVYAPAVHPGRSRRRGQSLCAWALSLTSLACSAASLHAHDSSRPGGPVEVGAHGVASEAATPADAPSLTRPAPAPWRDLVPAGYVMEGWRRAGRAWLARYGGVRWRQEGGGWELDPAWPRAEGQEGADAYYVEYAARPALNLALATGDHRLLDEVSEFYVVYAQRFVTLAELRRRQTLLAGSPQADGLRGAGRDPAMTLPWLQAFPGGKRWRECQLCNAQFFHPAARLLRAIAMLPPRSRSDTMVRFVHTYRTLVLQDHLLRLGYEAEWDYWGARGLPRQLVPIWRVIATTTGRPALSYQHAMLDWDLWLIATAAELLGAHATDPQLIPLAAGDRERLLELLRAGVALFQKKRTTREPALTPEGRTAPAVSYFDGDFDDHRDMAWAGYDGEAFPGEADPRKPRGASWDVSHFYRVPVFLRSLHDTRAATGVPFPDREDIVHVANQYVYRVFHGDFTRPLLRNFFDGSDGWYRVGYHGPDFGYPPSRHCDTRVRNRPCLSPGGIQGWGLLAPFHSELLRLRRALVELAANTHPQAIEFRERHYRWGSESFRFAAPSGAVEYPFLLWLVLSESAERTAW